MAKKQEKKVEMTRAQKTEATKGIVKELLSVKPMKHNELIEETARLYTERYKSEETENVNDVKGRAGSVLDIMKKESEVMYEGGMYALKARTPIPAPVEEVPAKKETKAKTKKTSKKSEVKQEEPQEEVVEQSKPAKKGKVKKTKEQPVAEASVQEKAEEPAKEEVKEEKPAPKKRGRKTKAKADDAVPVVAETMQTEVQVVEEPVVKEEKSEEVKAEALPVMEAPVQEEKAEEPAKEEPKKEEQALTVKQKGEIAQKGVVMDMSFLIGGVKDKAPKTEEKPQQKEEKQAPMSEVKAEMPATVEVKKVEKPIKKEEAKATQKTPQKVENKTAKQPQKQEIKQKQQRTPERQLSSDEKLREAFLKRIRSLGGDYFEYYSVYLLERYSMKNGRRLEMLRISGGDRDGGIDGEIELTDKFGFKETIYIQSKNWDPDKGKEEYWVVGETLLQQFIGACACRQARDGKQNCRGIFVTTSRFTPEAKRILDAMSDKIVGYDGNDLYEAAKECSFGVIQKNGAWVLDEKLLSGSKAFFNLY